MKFIESQHRKFKNSWYAQKKTSCLKFHQTSELFKINLKWTDNFCHFISLFLKGQRFWICKGRTVFLHEFSCSNSLFEGEDQALSHRVSFPSCLPKRALKVLLTPFGWQIKLKNKRKKLLLFATTVCYTCGGFACLHLGHLPFQTSFPV